MQLQIHSVHFDASSRLLSFVKDKVGKLDQFHDHIIGSEVFLKVEKNNGLLNKIAEIKIMIPGGELFAKKQCKTFEEATDTAIDALKRQIKRFKEKQRA